MSSVDERAVREMARTQGKLEFAGEAASHEKQNTPTRYQSVAVLLIHWSSWPESYDVGGEADALQRVFRDKYGFTTKKVVLDCMRRRPEIRLFSAISDFIRQHDGPYSTNLLIVYYSGRAVRGEEIDHSIPSGKTTGSGPAFDPHRDWIRVEPQLRLVEADVLTILDLPYTAARPDGVSIDNMRSFEILAAAGAYESSPLSFGQALIDSLSELHDEGLMTSEAGKVPQRSVDTLRLHHQIKTRMRTDHSLSPLLTRLRGHPFARHIILAPVSAETSNNSSLRLPSIGTRSQTTKNSGYASQSSTSVSRNKQQDLENIVETESITTLSSHVDLGDEGRVAGVDVFVRGILQNLDPDLADTVGDREKASSVIGQALRVYSYSLERQVQVQKLSDERRAMHFVRQQSRDIARKLVEKIASVQTSASSEVEARSAEPGMFSNTKDMLEWLDGNTRSELEEALDSVGTSATDVNGELDETIKRMRDFLSDNIDFVWLTRRVEATVIATSGDNLRAVSHEILNGLRETCAQSNQFELQLYVDWDLMKFLDINYSNDVNIADVICINSDEGCFEAKTVGEYLAQTWPMTGTHLCRILQDWSKHLRGNREAMPFKRTLLDGQVTFESVERTLRLKAIGHLFIMMDLGEQLAWLGSVLRVGQHNDRMSLARPRVVQIKDGRMARSYAAFIINFLLEELTTDADASSCWKKLFRKGCIASGAPIARREEEQGIEIPFAMMAELGGFDRIATYEGQLVLKGFETLFVPMKKTSASIVWHFATKGDGRRVSYNAIGQLAKQADCSISEQDLNHSRHYLGLVSNASQHAGTVDGEYDRIADVYLDRPGPGLVLSGAGLSVSKIVGVVVNFTRGKKDQGIRTSSKELAYCEIVEKMSKMHVLLYDHKDQRGWLLDANSAMLHLLRCHVANYRPIRESSTFRLDQFKYADPTGGTKSARDVLLDHELRRMVLIRDDSQVSGSQANEASSSTTTEKSTWTIEDRVRDLWELFEKMYDTWKVRKTADGVKLDRLGSKLEGWKFQDIVEREYDMEAVVSNLDGSADDWLGLIREINAVVLIGNGFGEIMRPAGKFCTNWSCVPQHSFCVAIPMSRLRNIVRKYGSPETTPIKLAPDVYWPILEHPFQCECASTALKRRPPCNRSQALRSSRVLKGSVQCDMFNEAEYDSGVVIFGGRKLHKQQVVPSEESNDDQAKSQRKASLLQRVRSRFRSKDKVIR